MLKVAGYFSMAHCKHNEIFPFLNMLPFWLLC